MKKLNRIMWGLILSMSPAISTDSMDIDHNPNAQRKVSCKSEGWKNGKKVWEKIEYIPGTPKEPIRPGGMGAFEEAMQSVFVEKQTTLPLECYGHDNYW